MKRLLTLPLLLCCAGIAHATVPVVPFTVTYTCTGGFGPFAFNFPISAANTLTVTLNGVLLASTSYTTIPVNNNYNNGGSVTLGGSFPCTAGQKLVLTRVTPIAQSVQFYDNMPALPIITGNSVDKLTEIAQELNGLVGQIVAGGLSITASAPLIATPSPITGVGVISCPTCGTSTGTVTTTGSPTSPELSCFSGSTSITNCNLSGDATTTNTAAMTLATVNSGPGTCGDATHVCQVTTNGKGLTTAQTQVVITGIPASAVPFSGITSSTNTTAAMVVGAGASLDYTSTGTIDASNALGHALPSLTTGFLNWTGSVWAFSAAGTGTVTSIATTSPITGGTITTTGTIACATCVVASSPGAGIARFAGSTQTVTSAELSGAVVTSGSNATVLATSYRTRSCEVVWGGSGTAFALTAGDDAAADQSCLNDIGVTETITSVKCRSDVGSNTTTITPTFGATGTGTSICSGALTCGSSGAYSSTCTVSNSALTSGSNINPVMGGTLTGTSIHMVVTYTLP